MCDTAIHHQSGWNSCQGFAPQTGPTFTAHHQVMIGQAETSLCAKAHKHTRALFYSQTDRKSPRFNRAFWRQAFPSSFSPRLPLSPLLCIWQSWHCEKFRAVRGNVRRLRRAICWTHKSTHGASHSFTRLIFSPCSLFPWSRDIRWVTRCMSHCSLNCYL